ncbi:NADH dehydrogenase subunit E [Haloactinospora alba]|uniref:NADH dehydrogenase subunit E n=1 Tax=Haloactinospora alba TaxID=405555 RepID=A0A543NMP7_9ACTN|nr:NADH-quinone oxidoreductase subunit NuoE [Haloactinospora alba]TQN33108.1 NADH dehydrogenase subunit E [Haloactinospora alba]
MSRNFSEEVRQRLAAEAATIIDRYPRKRSALLPLLHLVQAEEGYVSQAGITFCAEQLDLTRTEVAAVVTFYTMYKREPGGEYHVGVCTNTLCAVMGGDEIFASLKEHLELDNTETTEDGKVSLEHVECNAACDFAPVVMVNWEFFDNQTPDSARELVDNLRSGADVRPTRGPEQLCTWRQASRLLAGFADDHATEGVQAGEPTLAGLRVARERGWSAPDAADTEATTDQGGTA